MGNRKIPKAVLAAFVMTLSLSACSSDGDSDKEKPVMEEKTEKDDRPSNDTGQ
ncbi:hypothetical protein [Bacillus sp. T33-2]|uniref:hypothetical protein n=1 Tax=Bacillus sp. T33-2 TaxID=2054168 RepID=UPI0015E13A8A|nr:hypothetical protein [Bacillus sp. T33-2]